MPKFASSPILWCAALSRQKAGRQVPWPRAHVAHGRAQILCHFRHLYGAQHSRSGRNQAKGLRATLPSHASVQAPASPNLASPATLHRAAPRPHPSISPRSVPKPHLQAQTTPPFQPAVTQPHRATPLAPQCITHALEGRNRQFHENRANREAEEARRQALCGGIAYATNAAMLGNLDTFAQPPRNKSDSGGDADRPSQHSDPASPTSPQRGACIPLQPSGLDPTDALLQSCLAGQPHPPAQPPPLQPAPFRVANGAGRVGLMASSSLACSGSGSGSPGEPCTPCRGSTLPGSQAHCTPSSCHTGSTTFYGELASSDAFAEENGSVFPPSLPAPNGGVSRANTLMGELRGSGFYAASTSSPALPWMSLDDLGLGGGGGGPTDGDRLILRSSSEYGSLPSGQLAPVRAASGVPGGLGGLGEGTGTGTGTPRCSSPLGALANELLGPASPAAQLAKRPPWRFAPKARSALGMDDDPLLSPVRPNGKEGCQGSPAREQAPKGSPLRTRPPNVSCSGAPSAPASRHASPHLSPHGATSPGYVIAAGGGVRPWSGTLADVADVRSERANSSKLLAATAAANSAAAGHSAVGGPLSPGCAHALAHLDRLPSIPRAADSGRFSCNGSFAGLGSSSGVNPGPAAGSSSSKNVLFAAAAELAAVHKSQLQRSSTSLCGLPAVHQQSPHGSGSLQRVKLCPLAGRSFKVGQCHGRVSWQRAGVSFDASCA